MVNLLLLVVGVACVIAGCVLVAGLAGGLLSGGAAFLLLAGARESNRKGARR